MTLALGIARSVEPVPGPTAALQRKCACGTHTPGSSCGNCQSPALQRQAQEQLGPRPLPARAISQRSDPAELAAARMAEALIVGPAALAGPTKVAINRPIPDLSALPPAVGEVLRTGGQPLAAAERAWFEPRLSTDLGHVRIFQGERPAASANAVSARGYTVGSNIVLGRTADRRTLAHELVHVMGGLEARPLLWRYETPEHVAIGDQKLVELRDFLETPAGTEWAKKNQADPSTVKSLQAGVSLARSFVIGRKKSVRVSIGEVIALMADFYRTAEQLADALDEELLELLGDDHLVTSEAGPEVRPDSVKGGAAPKGRVSKRVGAITREASGLLTGAQAAAEYQRITASHRPKSDTFLELGRGNLTHFDPQNREVWKAMHLAAIKRAQAPGATDKDFEQALFIDSAAAHFLTDAFATGHLFNAQSVEIDILRYLQANPPSPANKELSIYYALAESQNAMGKLVLKNVHDRLNAEGFEVANPAGMRWKSYGDDHLRLSADAGRIAALAVYASRLQVEDAHAHKGAASSAEDVLRLLPDTASRDRISAKAVTYIPEAARGIPELIFRQRLVAKEGLKPIVGGVPILGRILPAIIQSNIETVADPLRNKQLEEAGARARETGMPQPVNQFTLGRF